MKKAGRYVWIAAPLVVGIAVQIGSSLIGNMVYGFLYGMQAAMNGNQAALTQEAVLEGYGQSIVYILIGSQLAALLIFGIWYKKQNKGKKAGKLLQIIRLKTIGWIVFWGIGLQLATNMFLQLFYLISPERIEAFNELMETAGVGEISGPALVATVIMAPIVEEIMFRGITMNLTKRAGVSFILANVLQAAAFGVYHANLVQGIYAALLGLVLGYVTQKYGSIYPAVLLHLSYNLAAMLLGEFGTALSEIKFMEVILLVGMIAAFVIGTWLFKSDEKTETIA